MSTPPDSLHKHTHVCVRVCVHIYVHAVLGNCFLNERCLLISHHPTWNEDA